MSNADITVAPILRNPAANDRTIAYVRSSLVGWRPPRTHGKTTNISESTEVTTSFASRAIDPVAFVTPRMRATLSTLAARSRMLNSAKENSGPGRLQGDEGEREEERDREDN
jgi:hypothetical protein